MQVKRRSIIAASALILALFCITCFVAEAQENQERVAVGNGSGTLRVGDQKFKISSVIVKLVQDRKVEITLVSDITIFLTGTWSNEANSTQEFDLQMSGSESRGGLEGGGKVVLSNDGKVTHLMLKGLSRATKRPVEANFAGK